ncbi:small integral membrane protein 3 [Arapaima gigas]
MADPQSEGTTQPEHILEVWVILLLILGTVAVMSFLLVCPALSVIIYRVRTGSRTPQNS